MKKLVIVGGGLVGSTIAKALENEFSVTLIDRKDYFEFTPLILQQMVHFSRGKRIQIPYNHYLTKAKIMRGKVTEISPDAVAIENQLFLYDYLVLAMGSRYAIPFKEYDAVLSQRTTTIKEYYENIQQANTIAVIGAGPVGVEFIGTVKETFPHKKLLLFDKHTMPLAQLSFCAQKRVFQWIAKNNVQWYPEHAYKEYKEKRIITTKGVYEADLVFFASGSTPNTLSLRNTLPQILTKRGYIKVNHYLQVQGYENIFAGGDLVALEEEKQLLGALTHAQIIITNIRRKEQRKSLKPYQRTPQPMLIALGKNQALFLWRNGCWLGKIPGLMKQILSWWEMKKCH